MKRIVVSDITKQTITRDDGALVRAAIESVLKAEESVCLDFEGKRVASSSFLDEAIAMLLPALSVHELRSRIRIIGLTERDNSLLEKVLAYRSEASEKNASAG